MTTWMEGGEGGGGATEPVPPSAQPRVHAPTENKTNLARRVREPEDVVAAGAFARRICGRGRIWSGANAGEGPAKDRQVENAGQFTRWVFVVENIESYGRSREAA
jgi:hypothetical protein